MNRSSIALLFPLYLAGVACGDDGTSEIDVDASSMNEATEETTGETSSAAASSSSNDSTTKREGPWGCYLQDHHTCDCSIKSEEDCDGVGLWTEGCASCTPSTETPNETSSAADAGEPVETSTDLDGGTPTDAATTADQGDAALSAGCYNPTQHSCACDTTEAACLADDGIWTGECGCAPQVDPTTSEDHDAAPVTTSEAQSDTTGAVDTTSAVDTSAAIATSTDECDSCFPADAGP